MTTLPDRAVLRAAYDAAIREIDSDREQPMLTTDFYMRIGDSLFDVCYRALGDSCEAQDAPLGKSKPATLHVVSAPAGAGKTSFSQAFIAALVRHGETNPDAPYGCVFVVDQITKAEQMYQELSKLLPGKVAIWTNDHDASRQSEKQREKAKVPNPSARHDVDDLRLYPVAIVTHAFYSGTRGHKAKSVSHLTRFVPRALTIVDEQPSQVEIHAVTYSQMVRVWEGVAEDTTLTEDDKLPVLELDCFMAGRTAAIGELEKPSDNADAWAAAKNLQWFTTKQASDYARSKRQEIPYIAEVFAFAKTLANGYAFVARGAGGKGAPQFIGYEWNLMRTPGMVLLDATADIDGVMHLCPWREMQEMPTARYDNLSIVHVPSVTRERLTTFLKLAKNRRTYVDHMVGVIKDHMEPGQRGLVVCKKRLIDDEAFPEGAIGSSPQDYSWDIEGRYIAITHWGVGIGANHWKDADAVFLFDEFYIPRRVAIANAQGLQEHKATEGALALMTTQNSKASAVDAVWEGHVLRWNKQMALRGRGRCFDQHGVCGKQKLVCTGDVERLLANKDRLFPGATVSMSTTEDVQQTYAQKLYTLLSAEGLPNTISTKWIGQQLHKPWRDVGKNLMQDHGVQQAIASLGWRYVSKRGRGGSIFERIATTVPIAA
jgi:hypothetical protein